MLPPAPPKKTEESSGLSLLPPPPKKEVSQPSIKAGNRLRTDSVQPEQAPTTEGLKQDIQGALTTPVKPINPFRGNFTPAAKEENKFGMQSPEKSRQVQRDSDVAVMEYENIKNKTKGLVEDLSFDPEKDAERKQIAETSPDQFGQMVRAEDKKAEETALAVQQQRLDKEARTFDQLPIEKEIDKLLINGPVTQPYPPQRPDEDFATWKEGYIQNERAQKDAFVDAATKDYFQYLKWIRPQDYDYEKSKYESIMAIPKEKWDEKQQKYIRDFRADAIAINARAVNTKLNDLEKTYNFDEYNRRMVEMGPEIDQLNAQIKTTAPDDPNYPALVQKAEQLQMFIDEVSQSTGVTDEAILEYGKLAGASKNLNRVYVYEKHKGDYSKVLDDEFSKEVTRRIEYEKGLKGEYGFGKFLHEAVGAFAGAMVSIPQNLKVWGDATGDTDYDAFDRMYDSIQYEKDIRTGGMFGDPTNEKDTYENLPFTSQIALTGGNAIGSMATFMLGGVAAGGLAKSFGASLTGVQLAQRAGTFTTAFLTTEPNYYQEARDAGMSMEEAAKSAAVLAALTAGAEMIVNDAAYVNGSSLVSSMGKLLKSTYTKGMSSKEATKLVGNAILQTVKSANKEGLEEVFQGDVESVTKEQINLQNSIEYFNTTYDAQARSRDYLGGFVAGGGMKAVMSSNSQHPDTEKVMLELARAQSLEVAAMYDPEILEMATPIITRLQENLQGLESHSNWNELSYDEQAHALALTNQISNIEEEKKKVEGVRLADKAKEDQVKALEEELNVMFDTEQQAKRDEYVKRVQEDREKLGVTEDMFTDMPSAVPFAVERMEAGQPVSESIRQKASDYLYNKYKELTAMKDDPKRMFTMDQIASMQTQLEADLTLLEGGKKPNLESAPKQETKPADSLQPATESKPKTEPVVAEDGSYTDENGNTQYIPPLLPLPDTNVQAPQAQRQVNQSEANVLTMLKDSKILSPTEKQMLYKQFKRGVMSENDISKYTQVNVDDIVAGETDKWARVVLDKIKAKQIDAEEIDFIEIPETNTQEDVSKKEEKIDVTEERVDALKDVESTEKALDELDKTDHKKVHELFDSMADMGVDISRRRRMGWSESAFITDEYHKAKADGTNPELVKAVEDLLAPKTTTGTEAPVATKTGKTVAPINLPPTVVEQGEDNVNMTDTPVVPFKKAKDLLGNDREPWMFEATESERSQAQQKNTMRGSQFFPKKIRAIQNALDNGLFQQAISDGKITSIDAVKIIESAGLAVPENILTKTKQEVKPEVKKGKNSAKAQAYRDKAKALRDGTGGTVIASVKLYAKALEVYADLLDTFDTVTEAIKEFRKTKEYQALEQGDRDEIENEIAEPPTELSGIKKALAPEEVVANTEVNRRSAEEMLDMGKKLVENGSIDPVAIINDIVEKPRALQPDEVAALVYYKAKLDKDISSTYNEIQKAMDSGDPDAELSARARANKLEIDLLSYQAMSVVTAYEQSLAFRLRKMLLDDQYNLADQITQYKANNGGTIPADVEARMREADKKIKEANAKIDELEKQQAELEKKLATQNIKEYNERQKKKSSTQKAKESADKFRERFKTKPLVIRDAAGNEITITTQGFTWNDVIEIAAKAIEKSGKIADGIKAAVDYLNGQDWYKNLSQEDKDAINTQLEEQFDEMLEGLKIPTSVVREFVENGVTDAEQLVKEVQKLYPEYSEREVMDAISGYGRKINPSIDEVRTELSRMKGVMRKLAMLEDLRNKIPKQKNPRAKAEMSKREKDLLKQIKEEFPEFGKMTEQERQDAAKVRAEEKIKEYEDRISRKDFSTKPKRKPVDMDSELIRLEAQKEKAKTVFEKEKEKLLLSQRKLGQTLWQGFKDLLNAPKAIRASLDLSAPFRQGAIFIFTQNPLKTARDIYDMYKMAGVPLPQTGNKWYDVRKYKSDKEYYEDWQNALKVSPYYPLAKRSGLYIADEDGKLTAREEVFMSGIVKNKVPFFGKGGLKERPKSTDSWAKKIWGLNLFGGSEQGYAGFLNKMRYDNFVAGAEQLISMGLDPIADAEEFKSWASFVNNATARGSLGKFEQAAETLNTFFFSPKMIAARFNLLMNPLYYYRLKPNARKMAMKRMSGFFGVMSMIIGMAAMYLNNDDDDETEVELDPRSSDFAKIKIGNTRIDVLAGFQQYIRASTQFATGERKSTKSGALSDADRFEVLVGFFANKLAPVPAIGYERARSKVDKYGVRTNMMGEVFDWKENLGELAIPLYLGDLSEIAQENSPVTAAFLATLSFHGGGVSSFGGEIDLTRKYAKKGAAMFEARTRREPNEEEYKLIVERANRQALQEIRENKRDRLKNDK